MDTINGGIENLDLDGKPEATALSSGSLGGGNGSATVKADGVGGEIRDRLQEEEEEEEEEEKVEEKLEKNGDEGKKGSEKTLDVGKVAPLPEKEEGVEEGKKRVLFPQRNGKLDCSYYVRTGHCAYGANCKFNHPPRTVGNNQVAPVVSSEPVHAVNKVETEQHLGGQQIECKYYLMPGGCKFGKACKYGHRREKLEEQPAMLNFLGLPLRPGQKECPYYMRSGSCKYSSNCRFNHPDPVAVEGHYSSSGYQSAGSPNHYAPISSRPSNFSKEGPLNGNASPSYLTNIPFQQKGLGPNPKVKDYQALVKPSFLNTSLDGTAKTVEKYTKKHLQMDFPERPGQPECPYFMKTGDCKFRSACKFHHPRSHLSEVSICDLSPCGLPLRPDKEICAFYSRFGICKYGPACKFHHPVDFNPPTSTGAKSSGDTSVSGNYSAKQDNKLVEQSA